MITEEVQKNIDEVRSALQTLHEGGRPLSHLPEGLQDLCLAVNDLRQSMWAVLTNEHAADLGSFLGRVRVRRATDICQDVLAEMQEDAFPPDTPGLRVFDATLRELTEAWGGEGGGMTDHE